MCIFSGPVRDVSTTRIFARYDGAGGQYLVYSMAYGAASDVAMILPLPVSRHEEDAVQFLSLEAYRDFFEDMERAFLPPVSRSNGRAASAAPSQTVLQVHDVGAFEASFVPTLDDFGRLDPRFTLPRQVWDRMPVYADYGFAVFKLRATGGDRTHVGTGHSLLERLRRSRASVPVIPTRVHPMAFRFPTRAPESLFFPTVHVHDGRVHPTEHFDHSLFFQAEWEDGGRGAPSHVERSHLPAESFMQSQKTHGIVDGGQPYFRYRIRGRHVNEDIWSHDFPSEDVWPPAGEGKMGR